MPLAEQRREVFYMAKSVKKCYNQPMGTRQKTKKRIMKTQWAGKQSLKSKKGEKIFDNVYRTMATKMPELMIPLINEK